MANDLQTALRTIAEYPVTNLSNWDAVNMRHIAQAALTSPVAPEQVVAAEQVPMTLDQFFEEAKRIGLTADVFAAQLAERPEFADCLPDGAPARCPFCGAVPTMPEGTPGVWRQHFVVKCGTVNCYGNPTARATYATCAEAVSVWNARAMLSASPEVAPAAMEGTDIPSGFTIVPLRMTPEMRRVTEQDDWEWAELLAAACAVDEEQYDIAATAATPVDGLTDEDLMQLWSKCCKRLGESIAINYGRAVIAALAQPAPVQAGAQQAVADGSTPGLWFVRKRERDGELLDCFVAAPDCQGLPYDAEILGDDEYREDTGISRKLADCELIVKAVAAYRAAPTQAGAGDAKGGA